MNVITSDMEIPDEFAPNIFLAGPTPRDENTKSWRIEALQLLEKHGFDETVYVPERKDWSVKFDYVDQVGWELKALGMSGHVLFWVPRDLETMPAFTTNVEFGMLLQRECVHMLYGRPDDAPKNRYLDYVYEKIGWHNYPIFNNLEEMIEEVVTEIKREDMI